MSFRILSAGALAVALVVSTGTLSRGDCDDDDDCCVRVCRPCRPCPQPCQPVPTTYCICPYYEMGGIWYAERFDIPTNNCMNGVPVAHPNGPARYCSGDSCGCGTRYSPRARFDCSSLYLSDCIDPELEVPPGVPHDTCVQPGGPHHLTITSIDGEPLDEPIHVAYYHMKTTASGKPSVPFWIGWQCTTVAGRGVNALSDPDCSAVLWVPPGGSGGSAGGQHTKKMLVHVTENGCTE